MTDKEIKKIQEEILQEQWQEEQERELLYEEIRIQNYDFDYGDVEYKDSVCNKSRNTEQKK